MKFSRAIIFFKLLKRSFVILKNNDPMRMAGATAFFTTFALPPILIILIQLFGLVFDPEKISGRLLEHLASILGKDSVSQIKVTLEGFSMLAESWYITLGGFLFLLFVATTLFKVIRNSIDQLWSFKTHKSSRIGDRMLPRLKSMMVIVMAGILFLGALTIEAIQSMLRGYINEVWPNAGSFVILVLNQLLSLGIVTIWFTVLLRFLPDGRPLWKVATAGGIFTGVLFTLGKVILGWMLELSNIKNIYGASGAFVLILLFVFYVSFILYYGAAFTYAWAESHGIPIKPGRSAYEYTVSEVRASE
jgi:membrane protein